MTSFKFPDPGEENFWNRYDEMGNDVVGLNAWREFRQRFPFEDRESEIAWGWLELIRAEGRRAKASAPRPCPRVFVSHKQEDKDLALDVAWKIHGQGFDVWIDIINLPKLPAPKGLNRAVLLAAMIEMGLINCTHLVAVMTKNTVPSRWVPYEYGRVKDDPPNRVTVAAWVEPPNLGNLPDYVYLAPLLRTDPELFLWLKDEKPHYPRCKFNRKEWPFD